MRLGIMQPYFLPYTEHFRLISACDRWVVFDTVKYGKKSWMNRNRIINQDKGWSYISVPVKTDFSGQLVKDVKLADPNWPDQILAKLQIYKGHAPFYGETLAFLKTAFAHKQEKLNDLNIDLLKAVCDYLEITTQIDALSTLNLDLPESADAGEWALLISKQLGAKEYRNPSGGVDLFDPELYAQNGITLTFHDHIDIQYDTAPFNFEAGLSIVDTLMWLGREKTITLMN